MIGDAFDTGTAARRLTPGRPLIIVDADEVLLRFVDGFDRFLGEHGLYLDLGTYRLHGNVKRRDDNVALLDVEVTALLAEFRRDLDELEPVEGAREALSELSTRADVVVLSNINPLQAAARRRNLDALGLLFPLVCNSGPKGAAAQALSAKAGRPIFFVDDIPQHLVSVREAIPHALLIHLVGDARLRPILPHCPQAHLRAESWENAAQFMRRHLESMA
jgi:FMN phosphatase YigB (HAD superfamily)